MHDNAKINETRREIMRLAATMPAMRQACYDALQWLDAASAEKDTQIAAEYLRIAQVGLEAAIEAA